jgi:hypothetical protein
MMIDWVKTLYVLVPLLSFLVYHTVHTYGSGSMHTGGFGGLAGLVGPVSTSSAGAGAGDWTYIGTNRGVETYIKSVKGTSLLAFRGVILLDMHISRAMAPYIDLSLAPDWVSMLKHIKQYPLQEPKERAFFGEVEEQDLVHQVSPAQRARSCVCACLHVCMSACLVFSA